MYIVQYARSTLCFSLGLWLAVSIFQFGLYIIQLRKKEIVVLAVGRVSSGYFPVWNVYRTVRKKDFMFLASVRVSSQYFAVSDCVSYGCAKKRSWLSLWLGLAVGIFQFWNVYRTVRKKDSVFPARVSVSSQYFPVWNVYRTVRKKDFVFLARIRVSSQYFPVLDCVSYSTQEGLRVSR